MLDLPRAGDETCVSATGCMAYSLTLHLAASFNIWPTCAVTGKPPANIMIVASKGLDDVSALLRDYVRTYRRCLGFMSSQSVYACGSFSL